MEKMIHFVSNPYSLGTAMELLWEIVGRSWEMMRPHFQKPWIIR